MQYSKPVEDIKTLVHQLDSTEHVQETLQMIANYLTDAYEACGDESLKQATLHLMAAHNALNERTGR